MIIEQIELCASDLEQLAVFYGDVLGMPVERSADGTLTVMAGSSRVVFQKSEGFAGRYHFALNISENRLTEAVGYLAIRQVPLIADATGRSLFSFDDWSAHAIYFYDPAGNIVEWIARHNLADTTGEPGLPFAPSEILCVSEIGFSTDDVLALVDELTTTLGITVYQESSPTFTAVGDENGLFILVQTTRHWFPDTGIPAEELPVKAIIRNASGDFFAVQGCPYMILAIGI